ncbi:MAG: DEAD/DEAH box helicase [Phytoplasma sp.]|uniref:DEAD/DEAH box helicase n=1 Tax=Phytoplasma sp. TaxID=2155 RepID=UPI002B402AC2|nr:DEAD/DEAH box helicase [Phytoplasma sp.]WRH06841.1 MAG: DEAD/DEAH box helicase [Phytoplasma sp.]
MSILFKELNLLKTTEDALLELNFLHPTPIQALVIPEIIEGHDIIAQSQTGTGKTFSFGIPIIEKIDPKIKKVQSLILCPTRELALQVFLEIQKLLKFHSTIKAIVVYGGESYIKQFQDLDTKPQIIIATPGRMIDLLERKKVELSSVKILTLDEADEMLKMGFQQAVETILSNVPKERQTILFSATMPRSIQEIAYKYQKKPKIIKVKQDQIVVKSIEQFYFIVKEFDKHKLLVRLLDQKNPDSVIIFANTKKDVDTILNYLQERDFLVDAIHGDLKQNQRHHVMNNFRKKNIKILVATDVAARGIDISDVKMVINYDLPHEEEVYVHRIGRTGRAGKVGSAYTFVGLRKVFQFKKLVAYLKEQITNLRIPTIEEVQKEQNKIFQENILHLIESPQKEKIQDNTFIDLLLEKKDSKEIISALLQHLAPQNKNYEYIAEPKMFKNDNLQNSYITRNNMSSNFNKMNNNYNSYNKIMKKPMIELIINLGKDDGINPSLLLKLLREKFNIYSKNIGNIKHFYNKTIFEIPSNLAIQIKSQNNIYYDNKLVHIQSK